MQSMLQPTTTKLEMAEDEAIPFKRSTYAASDGTIGSLVCTIPQIEITFGQAFNGDPWESDRMQTDQLEATSRPLAMESMAEIVIIGKNRNVSQPDQC